MSAIQEDDNKNYFFDIQGKVTIQTSHSFFHSSDRCLNYVFSPLPGSVISLGPVGHGTVLSCHIAGQDGT